MNPTELRLLVVHDAATIPLSEICDRYLSLSHQKAREAAALNQLPFPTFRLRESIRSPLMVHISDLANHIDAQHVAAQQAWTHSQV